MKRAIPKVSYLDSGAGFEKASKKFRKSKPIKLMPILESDIPKKLKSTGETENKQTRPTKQPKSESFDLNARNNTTKHIVMDASTINFTQSVAAPLDIIPPIPMAPQNSKGFKVAKAPTGRLLETQSPSQKIRSGDFNVYLVGKPIGHDPIDIARQDEQKQKINYREADINNTYAALEKVTDVFPTLEMDPYYALEISDSEQLGGREHSKQSDMSDNESLNHPDKEYAQYFKGIDEIDQMTARIGMNF